MKNLKDTIEYAEQHCQSHSTRLTDKRKQILSGLIESEIALSAYELIEVCKKRNGQSIPAMTMYRVLEFLESEGLVHKLRLANKYIACAHISCKHAHGVGASQFLICVNCSKVKEISINQATISVLKESVENNNFQLVSPQLELSCLCENCTTVEKPL